MLNIKIIGVKSDRSLEFEVNGKPGNGDGEAERNGEVHWKVKPGTAVQSIIDIRMKGRTVSDIFSKKPPKPEKGDGNHWKAQVNDDAPFDDYYYDIMWESDSGVETHDPKISVKPAD